MSYTTTPPIQNGCFAYWTFNESPQDNNGVRYDISGNGYHLYQNNNLAIQAVPGLIGYCAQFSGNGYQISGQQQSFYSEVVPPIGESYTFAGFVKAGGMSGAATGVLGSAYGTIPIISQTGTIPTRYGLQSGQQIFNVNWGLGTPWGQDQNSGQFFGSFNAQNGFAIDDNKWHFLVFQRSLPKPGQTDPSNFERISVDGGTWFSRPITAAVSATGGGAVKILNAGGVFNGQIAEFGLYTRVLSEAELFSLQQRIPGGPTITISDLNSSVYDGQAKTFTITSAGAPLTHLTSTVVGSVEYVQTAVSGSNYTYLATLPANGSFTVTATAATFAASQVNKSFEIRFVPSTDSSTYLVNGILSYDSAGAIPVTYFSVNGKLYLDAQGTIPAPSNATPTENNTTTLASITVLAKKRFLVHTGNSEKMFLSNYQAISESAKEMLTEGKVGSFENAKKLLAAQVNQQYFKAESGSVHNKRVVSFR